MDKLQFLVLILCNIIVILLYGDGTGNTVGELWLVLGNPYVLVTFSRGMQQWNYALTKSFRLVTNYLAAWQID